MQIEADGFIKPYQLAHGPLGISGWGCEAETLEPLAYTGDVKNNNLLYFWKAPVVEAILQNNYLGVKRKFKKTEFRKGTCK